MNKKTVIVRRKENVTIKDIVKKVGVAHSTASMVMNERPYVCRELMEKILTLEDSNR